LIRGFTASFSIYLDGLRVERGNFNVPQELFGLERIEVLKGPGSVLFGQGSLGGIVNQVSRRPGREASTYVEASGGSFGTLQGATDLNVPLTADGRIATRMIGLYRHLGDSIDFNDRERLYLAPSLGFQFGDTSIIVRGNLTQDWNEAAYVGLPAEGTILPNPNGLIPRERYIGEPNNDEVRTDRVQLGYALEHHFGSALTLRQNLRYSTSDVLSRATFSSGFQPDLRTCGAAPPFLGCPTSRWRSTQTFRGGSAAATSRALCWPASTISISASIRRSTSALSRRSTSTIPPMVADAVRSSRSRISAARMSWSASTSRARPRLRIG